MCPTCNSFENEWVLMSGRGTIYSYTIVEHSAHPLLDGRVPYLVILVELEEGVRIVSNLVGWKQGDEVRIGAPVAVAWLPIEDVTLPQFQLT
jgi:uncharacterized OB-fold protein